MMERSSFRVFARSRVVIDTRDRAITSDALGPALPGLQKSEALPPVCGA